LHRAEVIKTTYFDPEEKGRGFFQKGNNGNLLRFDTQDTTQQVNVTVQNSWLANTNTVLSTFSSSAFNTSVLTVN
jgi:hypothetical protein